MFPLALLNASSPPVDPSLTLILLHFDTDYTDSGQTAAVWSNSGSGQSISATSKFGAGSLATLSTGGIRWDGSLATLGNSDWTAEGWFYQSASSSQHRGLFMLYGDSSKVPVTVYLKSRILYAGIHFAAESFVSFSHQTTTPLTTFTHWALVRYNGVITLYLNGVASTATISASTKSLRIHSFINISLAFDVPGNIGYGLNGYQDEVRFRNEAVYTADFTPPTSAFTY